MTLRLLSHGAAEHFYDRLGSRLDTQAFYESPALHELAEYLELGACRSVVEFGCGTGRFAAELLESYLPPDARYLGVDISGTMVAITRKRLAAYEQRTEVRQSNGTARIDSQAGDFDGFICSYVLDLLSEEDIRAVLSEAHRILKPGGLLGLVSFTNGPTTFSWIISTTWKGLHRLSPIIVGGCRPIELGPFLSIAEWKIEHRNVVTPFGIPSEIVVARKLPSSRPAAN